VPSDFGHPAGAYNGILASALPLGSVIGLPLIPLVNDRLGRRWCILVGSVIMVIGVFIQGFAFNGGQKPAADKGERFIC
jgi:MFS family permease